MEAISKSTLAYVAARNRQAFYNLFVRRFKESLMTKEHLAERLGCSVDDVTRFLARPRNLELDTYSALIFAVTGEHVGPTLMLGRNPETPIES